MTHYDDAKETFRCPHGLVRGLRRCPTCEPMTEKEAADALLGLLPRDYLEKQIEEIKQQLLKAEDDGLVWHIAITNSENPQFKEWTFRVAVAALPWAATDARKR